MPMPAALGAMPLPGIAHTACGCSVRRPALAWRLRRYPRRGVTTLELPSCPLAIPSDQPDARKRCVPTVHLAAAQAGSRFAQTRSRGYCCAALPPAVATRPAPDALKRLDGANDTWPFTHPGQLPGNSCCAFLVTAARTVSVFRTRRRESLAWPARRLSPVPKHVHLRRGVSGFVNAPSTLG